MDDEYEDLIRKEVQRQMRDGIKAVLEHLVDEAITTDLHNPRSSWREERIGRRTKHDVERHLPKHQAGALQTLGGAVEVFIASRDNLTQQTIAKYRSVLGQFERYLGSGFLTEAMDTQHVQAFLDGGNRKPITRKTYSTTLSPFFNWLKAQRILEANPVEKVRLQKVPQKFPKYLAPEHVEAICEAICSGGTRKHVAKDSGLWLIPIVRANVYLGLRAGELVNLRWEHLDLERRTLTVANTDTFCTKSGKGRVIPLCDTTLKLLQNLARISPYVFPNYGGMQLHRQYLSRSFKRYARRAGLGHLNWHATRHTAASWLAQGGCSVEAIRRYMGHSSITVTQKYMHLSNDVLASQVNQAFRR